MKNPLEYVIPALATLLNTVKGDWQLSDDYGNPEETGNAIIIGDRSCLQGQDKSHFSWDGSFTIEVISRGTRYGSKAATEKAGEIMEILDSDQLPVLEVGFRWDTLSLGSINKRSGLNPADKSYAILLRYDFHITQQL